VALRAVCSEMLEPTKSKAVIWFFRSSRHGCKVRKYKKSAHHVTPILESTSHGHSSHTKLKSTHNDCKTVLPLYFLSFFPPFSASGTLRSLPHINGRKFILPNCQQELSASPQRLRMWPSVFISHSFNDTNDRTLSYTLTLTLYGLWTVNTETRHFLVALIGWKVGTNAAGNFHWFHFLGSCPLNFCSVLLTYLLYTLAHMF
jgi:hypothetical protein